MEKAVVIGSGIAGLASALRLKKKGYDVQVFESNAYAGGKLHAFQSAGFRFDFGPSLFTMPSLVDELFELHGRSPSADFAYSAKEVVCNYFWEDGVTFSVPADQDEFIQRAVATFDVGEKELSAYLLRNKEKYDLTADIFLKQSLHRLSTYLQSNTLKALFKAGKLHLGVTLDEVNRKYFTDPKLVQLFNRYATYNGSSPYATPGIMSMIPHLEMGCGTYFPKGGMHSISQSLYKLAVDVGVEFNFNEAITSIEHERTVVNGVRSVRGYYPADVVFSNMDVFSTFNRLLPKARKPVRVLNQERSSSALIFYWGISATFNQLDLHNIFFSDDYEQEFTCLFEKKDLFDDPTVYINITCKEEVSDAPTGCENWFVMINAPGNCGQDWEELKIRARRNVIAKLNRILRIDLESLIISESTLDPIEIEDKTSSHQGSLYGTSSNSKFASFLRHPNFSNQFSNLYFCGGSVHPGGGIPLCLLSAKIATDQVNG
jgi:phytoene desaturase